MIHARGLRKTYQSAAGRVDAVDAIDLDIAAGEFTAIVGSSGSGKSTLLNILGLLDRADSGKYTLNGHAISRASDRRLTKLRRNLIGFIFQINKKADSRAVRFFFVFFTCYLRYSSTSYQPLLNYRPTRNLRRFPKAKAVLFHPRFWSPYYSAF